MSKIKMNNIVIKMKPPTGARIIATLLAVEDFLLVGPMGACRGLGDADGMSTEGVGRLAAEGELV
jgi:hypothetical protein